VGDVRHLARDHVRAGLTVELDEELGVGRGFDVVLDAGLDHRAVACHEAHIAWERAFEVM
jgi:hypothetical protein